ncbi:lantibiotic dehydratase [Phytohabitans flavus]|uniref:lantibiotic dehydratase n=1 Tax=Phytohabitans flavus TaxID=1076124 RepID=UPI00362CC626
MARYWQRYCAKAETIGFFGPVCWAGVDADGPASNTRPGHGLLRRRRVYLEHWALAAYADHVMRDRRVRRYLPPALQPHLALAPGRRLLDPIRPPAELSAGEADLLARCDGRHTAEWIAAAMAADPGSATRTEEEVYTLLDQLARRGVLRWTLDVPVRLDAEDVLRDRLAAIGDPALRDAALAGLDRLCRARDAVAAAAGDPDALLAALAALDAEFTAVTGQEPGRSAGQTYAGRGLCWEDTVRDLDVEIGGPVLTAIAAPLDVVLRAARWVTAAVAASYLDALTELYQDLAAEQGSPQVPLGQLWYLAQGLFYGTATRPAEAVAADLTKRWAVLFGLDAASPGGGGDRVVRVSTSGLGPTVEELFPADRPGWSAGRIHSPDLQICAESAEAVGRGEFTAVLGEMHVAWATNACGVFVGAHPDPAALTAALREDLGPDRMLPLLPLVWPRYTTRLAFALEDLRDPQLGFAAAPGADPDRLVPISALLVSEQDGRLEVTAPDGRAWPLLEVFDRLLAEVAVDVFKLAGADAHTPRLVLDDMVVARETWRTTIADCRLAWAVGDAERYLAARAWARKLGLPDQVFVKIGTETKPMFADLTSPLYIASLASALRSARLESGEQVSVVITEMLPDASQAWVPDADGHRYISELRLQIRDPELPATRVEDL